MTDRDVAATAEALTIIYPGARSPAVRQVSLQLNPGETLVLLGPNGGGKTTLLKAFAGLLPPASGRLDRHARESSYVHQQAYIFRRSVRANLLLAARSLRLARDATEERLQRVATECRIDDLLNRSAPALSGGQQQRVALARALMRSPDVLLLDEPTANLDEDSRATVREIVRAERERGAAVLIATHDRDFAFSCGDRFIRMEYGRLHPHTVNILVGTVVERSGELTQVAVSETVSVAGMAQSELLTGATARLVFAPQDVVLSPTRLTSSARNQFQMTVLDRTDHRDGCDIVLGSAAVRFSAQVSRASAESLEVRPGAQLYAAIKASSISMYTDAYEYT